VIIPGLRVADLKAEASFPLPISIHEHGLACVRARRENELTYVQYMKGQDRRALDGVSRLRCFQDFA